MVTYKFNKNIYSKIALIKAAYNFTDKAYIHLDITDGNYLVNIEFKEKCNDVSEEEFLNEMLAQTVRHEVYIQTKNIRELLLARSLSSSIIADVDSDLKNSIEENEEYAAEDILKDWFENDD